MTKNSGGGFDTVNGELIRLGDQHNTSNYKALKGAMDIAKPVGLIVGKSLVSKANARAGTKGIGKYPPFLKLIPAN